MANVYDIIIRPIITERSMEATADKKYVFEVAPTAGKIEIKNAVEQIFGVKVAKVIPHCEEIRSTDISCFPSHFWE